MRIIEISIPHFTPSGTFTEARAEMQAIADDGFDVVFLMPIFPINKERSKSPYAVTAYDQVDPALGNLDEVKYWLGECHRLGMDVVLDIPLNHTSPAHAWIERDELYSKDAEGKMHPPLGTQWNDVLQLNHANLQVKNALSDIILFWLGLGFDGFRYDAASFMPSQLLENLIASANTRSSKKLHHWCDGVETYSQVHGMTAFLDHEGVRQLRACDSVKSGLNTINNDAIIYLSNHDTLQHVGSAQMQWGRRYPEILKALLQEKKHLMQSFAEWREPNSVYSFLA